MTVTMGRAAIYTRCSTEEQQKHGLSLDFQLEACRAAALATGAASVELFEDGGHSATTLRRPALTALRSRLPEFSVVYVYKLDRLSRSVKGFADLMQEFSDAGVGFVSVTEGIEYSGAASRLTMHMLSAAAAFFADLNKERVRDAVAYRARVLGLSLGKPPFGYSRPSPREPLALDPTEAPVVLELFRAYAAGDSLSAIARRLNAAGIPTPQGTGVWRLSQVRVLLRNRSYLGEVPHRGQYYPGHHPALIPARLWRQVEQRLAGARKLGAARTPRSLGVLLRCGMCGAPMRRGQFQRTRRPSPRYECRERDQYQGEQRHSANTVGAEKAEAAIWAYVEWLLERGGFREGLDLYLARLAQERVSGPTARARDRLRQVDAQLARALRGYSLGNLPEEVYLGEVTPLNEERARLQAQVEAVQVPADLRELAAYLRRITPATYLTNLRRQPLHVQAAFLGRLFERVQVQGNALTFRHRFDWPPWTMALPPRWSGKQESGVFTLPDGSTVTGRTPRG